MGKSFLNAGEPFITEMLQVPNAKLAEDKINIKGHHPVEAVNEADCIGCAFCATMCPDCIIKVER